ncbi:MAG: phospholipid carrier-dependent glycosyltransferase [Oscillospiraceae bacterium]|nr:phospholipid carrier-dependent glycosyltransferase [Oscillospiraceae bacterium]
MSGYVWILPAALLTFIFLYCCVCFGAVGSLSSHRNSGDEAPFSFAGRCGRPEWYDWIWAAAIAACYSLVAFWGLGNAYGPQTFFSAETGPCVISMDEDRAVSRIMYYSEVGTGQYTLEASEDLDLWSFVCTIDQGYVQVLKWHELKLEEPVTARYFRLRTNDSARMGEMAFYDADGSLCRTAGSCPLDDEQWTVPEAEDYLNSAYFDEIYHARTAIEFRDSLPVYEVSHPPLGKILILQGMKLFGENPFGWRFTGTLFGVLMLIPFYMLIKCLTGSSFISVCGSAIFALDFMHFVQTRISTIDVYAVFFIIPAYLFFFIWMTREKSSETGARIWALFLSGLAFGLGAASKWTVIYAGAGLAVFFMLDLILRRKDVPRERAFAHYAVTILCGAGFFVVLPAAIYLASYIPFASCSGLGSGIRLFASGDFYKLVWKNQKFMFTYHSDLVAEHPYSSSWWQWLVDARPILYWLKYYDDGTKSSFGAWVSPLVCWAGLGALAAMVFSIIKRKQPRSVFVVVGFLSQFAPWLLISRLTFAYHYFPAVVFLVLAVSCTFREMDEWRPRSGMITAAVFTALQGGLFVLFYPVLSGTAVSRDFCGSYLTWLPGWPFY